MIAITTLLIVIFISILVMRIASEALVLTGLSRDIADFQARSAFTGVGFTTAEAEGMMNHPLRRKIVLHMMLLGNAGIVTAMTSLILGFVSTGEELSLLARALFLLGGVLFLWWFSRSKVIERYLSKIIEKTLKSYGVFDVRDYADLLHLIGEYRIIELTVTANDWLEGKTLGEMKLRKEGVIVLGIERNNESYLGVPKGEVELKKDDVLILYGRISSLDALDKREKGSEGDREHEQAIREQAKVSSIESHQLESE